MNLKLQRLEKIFSMIKNIKVGLYGDFCLDSYWILDPRGSEISLETGLKANAVSTQKYSLGGASNVAANIAALKPKGVYAFGIYGEDVFGNEMISQLKKIGVNIDGMIIQNDKFDTYTFTKLILNGKEQPRIDFGTYNRRSLESDQLILKGIRESIKDLDIFIINQQVPNSITNLSFIKGLNEIISGNPDKIFIVDSRHFAKKFKNTSFKLNNIEAAKLSNSKYGENERIDDEELKRIAKKLYVKNKKPVFITRGENGILAYNELGLFETPGIKIRGKLDIVGAGDTALSAISSALGSGCSLQETIDFANLAAGVTVKKLLQTGTANSDEMINLYKSLT